VRTRFLLQLLDPALSHYRDRRYPGNQEQFEQRLTESTTLYIGNLSFYTTEEQVYEVRRTGTRHPLPDKIIMTIRPLPPSPHLLFVSADQPHL